MKTRKYRWILNSIAVTILITIAVQVYWNYNNYKINKQRVTNDIQISLDNALEEYYADIAKTDFLTIIKTTNDSNIKDSVWTKNTKDSLDFDITTISIETNTEENTDSILLSVQENLNKKIILNHQNPVDSISGFTQLTTEGKGIHFNKNHEVNEVQVLKGKKNYDSLKVLKQKLGTILISMDHELEYDKVDSLLAIQFNKKHITASYTLNQFKKDTLYYTTHPNFQSANSLSVTSKSTYIKPNQKITLDFENPYKEALKLSFSGILISFLLASAIISCLFYLLKIIKHQKQVAEVKNDLISNITHEFKTPIATIGVALESIKSFNAIDDKEKTKTYLDMSKDQLQKLNIMVEKLLETASLDSDTLELKKETINISELIEKLVFKHQLQTTTKTLEFKNSDSEIYGEIDVFHFENAINNVLDNAVKYGGNHIKILLSQNSIMTSVIISDNENTLTQKHKNKIFEKFYRVPKGNTHDVKGFGIGLYYTKKIIENHGGTISLELKKNQKTFKISIPNG